MTKAALDELVASAKKHNGANETAIGWSPRAEDFDLAGLASVDEKKFAELQKIDREEWLRELLMQDELFIKLHSDLPKEMLFQRELLISRL